MAERARHAFGSSENIQNALNSGAIDAYDILFLDGDTEPKVGWIDKNGVVRIVKNTDEKVEEVVEEKMTEKVEETLESANAYTDAQIEAKLAEVGTVEVVEF